MCKAASEYIRFFRFVWQTIMLDGFYEYIILFTKITKANISFIKLLSNSYLVVLNNNFLQLRSIKKIHFSF